ncbi:hypothetical protein SAMN04487826_1779 [Prevotella sp. khp1]|nr:hypothetical protein SAMN04487826_1779 [Prevotella sp. khp1]
MIMKTKKFIHALAALTIAATAFIACSSDDDDNNNNGQNVPESEAVTSYDDLSFFQNAIVSIDSLGNFLCRHYGQPLYDNDTTQLYIGVETLAQAEEIFRDWVAPTGNVTKTGNDLTYLLTDYDGKMQGSILFTATTSGGKLAEVTPSSPSLLKHFSKVIFLSNSSWPYNSTEGKYRLGDIRELTVDHNVSGYKNVSYNSVCIREKGNGVNAMFVAISPDLYVPKTWTPKDLLYDVAAVPGEEKGLEISKILRKDWNFFVSCFDAAGMGKLNRDEKYWLNKKKTYLFKTNQWCIDLSKGDVDQVDFQWHNPEKHFLVCVDWLDD